MPGKKKCLYFYCMILLLTLTIVQWSNRTVTTFVEKTSLDRNRTVVIDPGHGGVDGGAISYTGVSESKLNLQISMRLNDMFHFLGYQTKMIRTEDISVYREGETIAQKKRSDLKERIRMVAETDNAILLSIHQNNFPQKQYSGGQIFYADTEESKEIASELQHAFVTYLNPGSNRHEKKCSGVYLMEHIQCPGVLIECGFLSNPQEEANLLSQNYQQKLCCVIAATVAEYISNT